LLREHQRCWWEKIILSNESLTMTKGHLRTHIFSLNNNSDNIITKSLKTKITQEEEISILIKILILQSLDLFIFQIFQIYHCQGQYIRDYNEILIGIKGSKEYAQEIRKKIEEYIEKERRNLNLREGI
jgi:hypothetical protein